MPTVALLGVFAVLFYGSLRKWVELESGEAVIAQLVLAGTIIATMVVSAFDVVLLLGAPSLLVWSVLGATSGIRHEGRDAKLSSRAWGFAGAGLLLVTVLSTARSGAETVAMITVGRGGKTAGWVNGAELDPGSYRINLRVADLYYRRGHCGIARGYARRAGGLFPHALAPKRILNGCG